MAICPLLDLSPCAHVHWHLAPVHPTLIASEFKHGLEVPGILGVVWRWQWWVPWLGTSRSLSANVTWVVHDVTNNEGLGKSNWGIEDEEKLLPSPKVLNEEVNCEKTCCCFEGNDISNIKISAMSNYNTSEESKLGGLELELESWLSTYPPAWVKTVVFHPVPGIIDAVCVWGSNKHLVWNELCTMGSASDTLRKWCACPFPVIKDNIITSSLKGWDLNAWSYQWCNKGHMQGGGHGLHQTYTYTSCCACELRLWCHHGSIGPPV